MSALGLIDPPKPLRTLAAVMGEVWTERLRRYANVELMHDPLRACAWRAQGDLYRWAMEPVMGSYNTDAARLALAFDRAISTALSMLLPLTASEALEAGEMRRCRLREWRP